MSKKERDRAVWALHHPKNSPGFIGYIDAEGRPVAEKHSGYLETLISQIRRGVATETAKKVLCVPANMEHPKLRDCRTLHDLFGKKHSGNRANLRDLPSELRYAGRVDWADPSIREKVQELHSGGESIRAIARCFGVTHQALTKANRKHQLYPPRKNTFASGGKPQKTGDLPLELHAENRADEQMGQ